MKFSTVQVHRVVMFAYIFRKKNKKEKKINKTKKAACNSTNATKKKKNPAKHIGT